jgi:hypothetical protein
VIWDVHEDTAAALGTKAWLPCPLRPPAAVAVHTAERMAERYVHLILAEHGYVTRFARPHPRPVTTSGTRRRSTTWRTAAR